VVNKSAHSHIYIAGGIRSNSRIVGTKSTALSTLTLLA